MSINTEGKAQSPTIKLNSKRINNNEGIFVVDTGAELNLIKRKNVNKSTQINTQIKYHLFGIVEEGVKTVGEVYLEVNGVSCPFQIVPDNFPIKCDGMLGMPFLADAIIDLKTKTMKHALGKFPFITPPKRTTLYLNARTKQLVTLPVTNTNINEGYLPLVPAGPGVYLGETLATVVDGQIRVYCINVCTKDVEILVSPVSLEKVEFFDKAPRSVKRIVVDEESESKKDKRFRESLATLNLTDLNSEEKSSLLKCIKKFSYQFFLLGDKLTCTNVLKHSINTIDNNPVHKSNYRYPVIHKEVINTETTNLKGYNAISTSNSPYNSPVWVVPKKSDSKGNKRWRMVIDYRALNEKTVGDAYPLPNITDILDQLGGAKYFTVLDLASGFHQIEVEPADRHKTAFSTPFGHYQFNRMPFGLKNAPATFQRLMDRVLTGLQGIEMFVYMDDIVIYAKSLKEHNEKLENLLGRLKTAGLVLQPDKCRFLCKEIGYLGHVISEVGVKPDPKKIEAVSKFPCPKGRKNVKQFLGLAGYYRRFIPDFASIAKPMTVLLKKNVPFTWTETAQMAFNKLKNILCSKPILQYPDFTKPFIITTDASDYALGAILSQGAIGEDLPIAFASRTLSQAEINYNTTEKELLAIIFAVKHFRPYVYGQKFSLITDHRSLIWLDQLKDPTMGSRLARWKIKLQEYDYKITFKPGKVNANADALSRNPIELNDSKNKMGSGRVNNENKTMENSKSVCFNGSNVLYHEYPIERVFSTTARKNEDFDSVVISVNKCSNDENCADIDTNNGMNENRLVNELIENEKILSSEDECQTPSLSPQPISDQKLPYQVESDKCGDVNFGSCFCVTPKVIQLNDRESKLGKGCKSGTNGIYHQCRLWPGDKEGKNARINRKRRASSSWATRGGGKNRFSSGNGEQPVIEVPSLGEGLSSRGVAPGEGAAGARCLHWVKGCRHAGLHSRGKDCRCEMPSLGEGLSTRGVIPYKKGERCPKRGVVSSEDWLLKESTNPPAEGGNSVSAGHSRKLKSCDGFKDNEGNKIDDYHVNNDDENELSENEMSDLIGVWGNVLMNACDSSECFEQMGLDTSALAEATPVLITEGKQGNQILTPLFQLSKDKLWMRDDNIINFSSCDGVLTTPVGRELSDNSIIKISDLKEINAELGYVSSTIHEKHFVYNLFIKETFDAKVFAKNIEKAVSTLREAMEAASIKSISISREGNGFDKMSWSIIERIFRTHFGKGDFKITVCTGEIQIPSEEQRLQIIRESHDSTVGGHKGETKTLARVREKFYWKGMRNEIREYVKTCETCQKRKLTRIKTKMPMRITDTPSRSFEKVQIDLVGPLPLTESGNLYMLTWQDCLSKFSGAIPLSKIDAPHIAVALAENLICIFGCPEAIQTDQGSQFMSQIMNSFAALFKIRQYRSSAYHPQSLGALERSHHTFVEYLRNYCERSNWDQWLPYALFSFNTSVHESTGMTPHEIVFGRKVRFPTEFADEEVPRTYVDFVDEILNRIVETESLAFVRLEAAKRRCKKYYDRKINERVFEINQYVYVLNDARDNKFEDHYLGPFKITKVIDELNIELQMTPTVRKIVHVNRVKHAFLRYI